MGWRWLFSPLLMDPVSLVGPRRGISHQDGGIALLATSSLEVTNVAPGRTGLGTSVSWAAGSWACPSTTPSLMGMCVGNAPAEGFPGVSSGGWQPSSAEGVWGHGCASSMALCPPPPPPGGRSGLAQGRGGCWDRVSEPGLALSLLPFPSAAAGWVPPCRGFRLLTPEVIPHWRPVVPLPPCHYCCKGPLGILWDLGLDLLWEP